jgi:hypothetical protein
LSFSTDENMELASLKTAVRIVLVSYAPVIVSIMVMIVLRADDLAREATGAGLEPGFFVPTSSSEAVASGFSIWIPGALFVGVLAYALYAVLRRKLSVGPTGFFAATLVLGVLMSAGLWATDNPFAPEGTFEMLACGIGYGLLIPYLSRRWGTRGDSPDHRKA